MGTTTVTNAGTVSRSRRHNPLWWIVVGAFVVQLAAWTVWFLLAAHHRVQEVPLETTRIH